MKLKRTILAITTVMCLFLAGCSLEQQELFFVDLGDSKAKTQTLEEARDNWHVSRATEDQKKVLKALEDQKRQRYLEGVHRAQMERKFYEGIVASRRSSSADCYQAVDKHFSGNKAWFKKIVSRESGNNPAAANPSSSARGCAQLLMSLHSHRFTAVGCSPSQWANPDCNIKAANHLYVRAGSSPWALTNY